MLKFLCLILSVYSLTTHAQSREVYINGTLTNSILDSQEHIRIVLLQNSDTLDTTETDEYGKFLFNTLFFFENDYSVIVDTELQRDKKIKLHSKGDSISALGYTLDLIVYKAIHDKFNSGAYYEFKETRKHTDFELEIFKQMLAENTGICVLISQTKNPQESDRIAKQRMRFFKKELIAEGVDVQNITFSNEILLMNLSNSFDQRSRIEPVILSLDGNCK